jgi:hypothetical protein
MTLLESPAPVRRRHPDADFSILSVQIKIVFRLNTILFKPTDWPEKWAANERESTRIGGMDQGAMK